MKKIIAGALLAACSTMAFSAYHSDNCNYGNTGGYNSPSCHIDIEERVSALEAAPASQDGINGTNGLDGVDGRDGVDGLAGVDGANGTNSMASPVSVNGVDGRDGIDATSNRADYIDLRKETRQATAENSAIAMLGQSPHGQNSLSVGCGQYKSSSECAVGGTFYIDNQNLMFRAAISQSIVGGSVTYHFGE